MALSVMLVTLVTLFLLNVPIAFAMIVGTTAYFWLSDGFSTTVLIQRMVGGMESVPLLAIIFFLAAGILMNHTGITRRVLRFAVLITARLPGSLAQVNVLLSTLMSGLSGSNIADAAMTSKILVPEMEKKGYSRPFSAALTAASALITGIIPPSIGLIMYGYVGNVSIGDLFLAGVVPGLGLCVVLMIYVHLYAKANDLETEPGPKISSREFFVALLDALLALLMPVGIIGGIRVGLFSATEAGAIAILYSLVLGMVVYRELSFRQLWSVLVETTHVACSVLIIIAAGAAFGWVLTFEQLPQRMAEMMAYHILSPAFFFMVVFVFLLVIGMFVEGNITIIVLTPLFMPMLAQYGINPVHFGIFFVLAIAIGTLTPPLGTIMFAVCSITKTKIEDFIRSSLPFLGILTLFTLALAYIPSLSLWLPSILK